MKKICVSAVCFLVVCFASMAGEESEYREWKMPEKPSVFTRQLKKNGVVITDSSVKQIFSFYIGGGTPYFITSDSLLNAFHVLFEESVSKSEKNQARKMPLILKTIINNLDKPKEELTDNKKLLVKAKKRAKLVVGIAMKLLDDSYSLNSPELEKLATEEVAFIIKGEGMRLPPWLGEPSASLIGFDYSRYRPQGFYAGNEKLEKYFRAVSWLQSVPFRVSNDEELMSILLLANAVAAQFDHEGKCSRAFISGFFNSYNDFLGTRDNWDILYAASEARRAVYAAGKAEKAVKDMAELNSYRDYFIKNFEREQRNGINDQLRVMRKDGKPEIDFRIMSAYRIPDALMFNKTANFENGSKLFPDGLEVATVLGSVFAREELSKDKRKNLLATIDQCKSFYKSDNLYCDYLNALVSLLDKPEKDAPDFMKTKTWQVKSCNTVLAGWAQLRHTWSLQAKKNVSYCCDSLTPPGFVEPEPEFFSRMAKLCRKNNSF